MSNHNPLPFDLPYVFSKQFKVDLLELTNKDEFGIENLKKIEAFKANLIKKVWGIVDGIKQGNNPTGWIVFSFFGDVFDFAKILRAKEEIKKEFEDLTNSELLELDSVFISALKLDSKDIDVEEFIERTNYMIATNADYIRYLTTLKK